jgi:hypothetical protein
MNIEKSQDWGVGAAIGLMLSIVQIAQVLG